MFCWLRKGKQSNIREKDNKNRQQRNQNKNNLGKILREIRENNMIALISFFQWVYQRNTTQKYRHSEKKRNQISKGSIETDIPAIPSREKTRGDAQANAMGAVAIVLE